MRCVLMSVESDAPEDTIIDLHQVAEIFDARAPGYAHDDWHRRYAAQFVAAVPLRAGDRVLDAGTGTGFAAMAIARAVGERGTVLGVDVSPGMLAEARKGLAAGQLSNVEVQAGDATDMPHVADASVDVVTCAAGLLYMPAEKALREWARVLRPGGVVAFSTMKAGSPSAGRLFRECAARFGLTLHDPSAALGDPASCREALEQAGFTAVTVVEDRVDFDRVDPTLAWEANARAAGVARLLEARQVAALREQYFDALSRAMHRDAAAASRADVLYAIARRPM